MPRGCRLPCRVVLDDDEKLNDGETGEVEGLSISRASVRFFIFTLLVGNAFGYLFLFFPWWMLFMISWLWHLEGFWNWMSLYVDDIGVRLGTQAQPPDRGAMPSIQV
ncbi:hypothetical protein VTJ04DRAFT_7876 [Mycothermus thermophilus]|uniref:uncharacterized protein n=1 Tax=Humicola insolens TaxID=85995 RepID=UPI003743262A